MNANDMNYKGAVLHVLRGLPRAGKSTRSAALRAEFGDIPVVSCDSIRLALHGKPFVPELESAVHATQKLMIGALLYSGHRHLIIDECHVRDSYVNVLRDTFPDANVKEEFILTPVHTCIQRALDCDQEYLVPVIRRMWRDCDFKEKYHG